MQRTSHAIGRDRHESTKLVRRDQTRRSPFVSRHSVEHLELVVVVGDHDTSGLEHIEVGLATELEPAPAGVEGNLESPPVGHRRDEAVAEVAHARSDRALVALEQDHLEVATAGLERVREPDDAGPDHADISVDNRPRFHACKYKCK